MLRSSYLILGMIFAIFLVVGLGIVALQGLFNGSKPRVEVLGTTGSSSAASASPVSTIVVDVAGAVVHPGTLELPSGSRVEDAVKAAGGLSDDADAERIAREVNRAARIQDGAKLYIPRKGEVLSQVPSGTGSQVVNINAAGVSELDALPGVGPVTAQKIITNRPYTSVDELLTKKILSKTTFTALKDRLVVY